MSGRGNTSMGDHLRVNHLGITSHLGQLGLSSFRGSINEYRQYAGGKGMRITSVGWQVTLCDVRPLVMWDLMSTAVVAIKSRILYSRILPVLPHFLSRFLPVVARLPLRNSPYRLSHLSVLIR